MLDFYAKLCRITKSKQQTTEKEKDMRSKSWRYYINGVRTNRQHYKEMLVLLEGNCSVYFENYCSNDLTKNLVY